MSDLSVYSIRHLFKYVAIKAHYLFRQTAKIKTLTISKHDWKYYEAYNKQEMISQKYIKYKSYIRIWR